MQGYHPNGLIIKENNPQKQEALFFPLFYWHRSLITGHGRDAAPQDLSPVPYPYIIC
jgi:hypothetical protein